MSPCSITQPGNNKMRYFDENQCLELPITSSNRMKKTIQLLPIADKNLI